MRRHAILLSFLASAMLAPPAANAMPPASRFSAHIDNPYLPWLPGSRWVYRSVDREGTRQRIVVTALHRTKIVDGIRARVVHDVAFEEGSIVEDTFDWYAQDRRGNVWYLGEDTKELDHGKVVSTEGSWESGVDGARGGIVMRAHPRRGKPYVQEHYPGHAEDKAQVLSRHEQAGVPFGHFRKVLLTKEFTPLEPKVLEYKLYARGRGEVLALTVSGGSEREELVRYRRG